MAEADIASDFFCPSIVTFMSSDSVDSLLAGIDFDALFPDSIPVLDQDPTTTATPIEAPPAPRVMPLDPGPGPSPTSLPATPATDAFAVATNADLLRFLDKNNNSNTTKTTVTWVNRFETWRQSRGIPHKLELIPPEELDRVLQQFFAELRKQNGGEYEPGSLRTMLAALDRFLREKGCCHSILKDRTFEGCRKLLNGKAIELREMGMGKKKNKADALTEIEEEQLWSRGALGDSSPKILNYTVFFILSQQFGTRGCQEHHQICIEHLKFVRDPTGKALFVEWVEGITKTRQGGLSKTERRLPQRMFSNGNDRCPIRFLELLISKRPPQHRNSGPLYLRPLDHPKKDVWYSCQPIGARTINTFMKEIAKIGGLDCTNKKFTNHSVRKTTVRKLQKAGVSNDRIAAITGHKNEQSLRDYADADPDDHRHISEILTNPRSIVPVNPPLQQLQMAHPPGEHPHPTVQPAPQYNFSNCTVYFSSSASSTQVNNAVVHPQKRRRLIIDSDSEED